MTLYIPLDPTNEQPNSPPFLVPSLSPDAHLKTVIQSVLKAKRIAVVCGAGISVDAGIPDFRSQDGLFRTLKRDNPKESLTSGKDLFDASVFKSTQKTALFYRMIARLASLSSQGQPTAFHQLLRTLDDRGQLLRVYTQNIDALEMKAGLSFGVPEFEEKELRVKLKGKAKVKAKETGNGAYNARLGSRKRKRPAEAATTAMSLPPIPPNGVDLPELGLSTSLRRATSPLPSTSVTNSRPNVIPRCIPLHGTLLTLHCQHCTQSFPLDPSSQHRAHAMSPPPSPGSGIMEDSSSEATFHSLLARGTPPPCPSCTSLEQTRALVGKRLRGVGKLRPSVVLYGEEHREGEGVGEAVRRDLCGITDVKAWSGTSERFDVSSPSKSRSRAGRGPDLLLVVGTSLRVPGTKRIVREFSKAVRPSPSPFSSRPPTPTPSPPAIESSPAQVRTIYLNYEFPLPSREWEGVFDVWVNGDVQTFAKDMAVVIRDEEEKQTRKKEKSMAKREAAGGEKAKTQSKHPAPDKTVKKRTAEFSTPVKPTKKRKVNVDIPPTPMSLLRPSKAKREDPPHPARRKVILRLPPPPSSPPMPVPSRRPLRRTGSIPEVVITSKARQNNRPSLNKPSFMARSLSPLTSLSSLTSVSSLTSLSSATSSALSVESIELWRKNLDRISTYKGCRKNANLRQSGEGGVSLSTSFPKKRSRSWQRSSSKYTRSSHLSTLSGTTGSRGRQYSVGSISL